MTSISGGYRREICGLDDSGGVVCWNTSEEGEYYPVPDKKVSYLGTHNSHAYRQYRCGILGGGSAFCWYSSRSGRNVTTQTIPLDEAFFEMIGTGTDHACGLIASESLLGGGTIHCWGSNRYGQATTPPTVVSPTPVPMSPNSAQCYYYTTLPKGSSCKISELGNRYRFAVTDTGQAILYGDSDGGEELLESRYGSIDHSWTEINGNAIRITVVNAHANPDGSWTIDKVGRIERE